MNLKRMNLKRNLSDAQENTKTDGTDEANTVFLNTEVSQVVVVHAFIPNTQEVKQGSL